MSDLNGSPDTVIRAYPDGPIIVRGSFELEDEDGNPIVANRATIALCRCGKSAIKPFCDGTHSIAAKARAASATTDS
jgi:CDGSH-type Zn-finger protein